MLEENACTPVLDRYQVRYSEHYLTCIRIKGLVKGITEVASKRKKGGQKLGNNTKSKH
jgi:hypothetical protein